MAEDPIHRPVPAVDLDEMRLAVAELGREALRGHAVSELAQTVVERVARTLAVELVKVLELTPARDQFRLLAGVGWHDGLVGVATVGRDTESLAGYTLTCDVPVIVEDVHTEKRFHAPSLLVEHDVISGISVAIGGVAGPFGVLGVHTREQRTFAEDESRFLASVATVLAEAIRRETNESMMREIVETAVDGIITINQRGTVESINPAGVSMFGYAEQEVIGKNVSMLMPSPYAEEHDGYLSSYLNTNVRKIIGIGREVTGRRKGGDTFPMDLSVAEFVAGGRMKFTGIVRDLTDRKRLEQELLQAQKMEAIGRLAGGIAHDFNNLLSAIIHGCSMVVNKLDAESPARDLLEEIRQSARKGAGLTRQLLDFSRKRDYEPRAFDLNELIVDSSKMIKQLVGEDVTLHLGIAAADGMIMADPTRIEQILLNLAVNARDAMPQGGEMRIATCNIRVTRDIASRLGDLHPGPYVVLDVGDTGCGMDETTRAKIFEPFFTTKAPGRGTGLGLSTVYGIVRQCGGHVTVSSTVGRGTRFSIYFPTSLEESDSQDEVVISGMPRGRETILLVEDERLVRAGIRFHLGELGYQVLEADGAEAALRVCDQHEGTIDLLLTDIVMPGMSGAELGRVVEEKRDGIRCLYMSAYPGETLVAEGRLAAGLPTLEKPFTEQDLAAKVREVLG